MAASSPSRRRQRSARVTFAGLLLAFAALAVVLAVPPQSPGWLSAASVTSLLCGIAAFRIMSTELLQGRREAAGDRVAQARAYELVLAEQAAEHAAEHAGLTLAMTDHRASRERSIRKLRARVRFAEGRAVGAESQGKRESLRADEAWRLVAELRVALAIRQAEEADELASWESAGETRPLDAGTVVDLIAWEDRVDATTQRKRA